ncbi:3-hydroxyacyl-CoA dehydrogenase/enoyl-CoA hydratase/3-hydroxybutyryl-CoA epimerase [Roseinatronobacter thiooxidans]|uniref:enoyl-CoA hydratase n=1 Tax=Roseinatronobacter thiooxidans TaxID=121821 RepID=A0A2W7QAW8_9RHOB|nr:3-hydroxyacyl-CoA dehydrogenase NAD-binding domain-containing protein [Roseinatronobacter thiooxidans]PZX45838.1 3-hydroxyacyl-CoA dehydrogenase/enoyl-CoA hydratase/3-hydroxybutyryl-CoA epimerase [Roseinatronobacter thiooxidans]
MNKPFQDYLAPSMLELGGADMPGDGDWRYGQDTDQIGWLVLDRKDASVNTISDSVLRELDTHLDRIEAAPPRALVLRSGKSAGFAAGADIHALAKMDAEQTAKLLSEAHAVLHRLEGLSCPTIAVVHGAALGAGFEMALACDYRIAIEGASFGLPEVQLGLHPGLGGTVRLPALIDPLQAMQMMLTGKTAHTRRAQDLGIADIVTEERHVRAATLAVARGEVDQHKRGLMGHAFSLSAARILAADRMRREVQKKAPKHHYPAPYALIEIWAEHGNDPNAMQKAEIASFAKLLQTETSKNLIRAFMLRQTLKSGAKGECDIARVHVVGAGVMGAEIAAWGAMQGKQVTVTDPDEAALGKTIQQAAQICKQAHKDRHATRDTLDRLMPDPRGYGARHADLVIEAGPENPEVKAKIFAELAKRIKTGAILATNTSSLHIGALTKHVPDTARFAGLHFFNPVNKVPLVEVVSHDATSPDTRARLMAFCTSINRLPVAVTDAPGFLVNRALMPYLLEALLLIDEGTPKERIDRAALDFGMPMGPVTLADQVGLDICLDVAQSLQKSLDGKIAYVPALLRDKVEAGDLGRKTGRGFYDWSNGTPTPATNATASEDLTDRLILPMLDACAECLRKGVVANRDDLDAAMIFATGFAPFRGGPMHYAATRGFGTIHTRLEALEKEFGARFQPDPYWATHA